MAQIFNPVNPYGFPGPALPIPVPPPEALPNAVTTWKTNYLVSNRLNMAAHQDPALVNPWGLAVYQNQIWVINNNTDTMSNYDLFGNRILGPVNLRDAVQNASFPTGIAINCGGGFSATNQVAGITRSARIMICNEQGMVEAFNPTMDPLNGFIVLNRTLTGEIACFKGLAIANDTLYLADFFGRHIDVFDSNYNRILGYHFIDSDMIDPIPLDYAPHNIVHIGCLLYVLWAKNDPFVTLQDINGPGHGFISVFNLDGTFVRRLTSRGVLNSPWGMIPAPLECGLTPGSFLVGNEGDGRINAFDCEGRYLGPLIGQNGLPVHIQGLKGMAPYYTNINEIFWAATSDPNIHGMLGSLVKDQVIYY